jgi:hypothetical protein
VHIVTTTPHPSPGGMLRELARREARARDLDFAAGVAYFAGLSCPFPVVVTYWPERELLTVTAGRLKLATMTAEEARRAVNADHAAALLGLRAGDAYLALPPLDHDHILGQD